MIDMMLWERLKEALIESRGRDGAASFLEHAAATMRTEAAIERAQADRMRRAQPNYQIGSAV